MSLNKKNSMSGEQFKNLRIRKGFKNRSDLANILSCSIDAIRKWETGLRRVNPMAISFLKNYTRPQ